MHITLCIIQNSYVNVMRLLTEFVISTWYKRSFCLTTAVLDLILKSINFIVQGKREGHNNTEEVLVYLKRLYFTNNLTYFGAGASYLEMLLYSVSTTLPHFLVQAIRVKLVEMICHGIEDCRSK